MAEKVNAVPKGFHTLSPHLTVRDAARAIDFYRNVLGAELLNSMKAPDGKIMHAALKVGDSIFMLNDEFPEWGNLSPLSTGGTGVAINVYIENVDVTFAKAISSGATVKMPLTDQFWGDRYGQVTDPFGHVWSLATHVRDVSAEEMQRAQDEMFSKMPKSA